MDRTLKREYELKYEGKEPEDSVLSIPPAYMEQVKAFGNGRGWANMLVSGDNLHVLKALLEMKSAGKLKNADGSSGVRLVYIDPPFSTNLNFHGKKKQKAYEDKLIGADFIEFIRKRLILIRELLSVDGSIYLHLDWKKAHYIKAVMDEVFGEENFLNDIIWSYGGRGAKAIAGQFSRNHDIILWYKKGERHVFNQSYIGKKILKGTSGFKEDESGRWFKTSPRGDYTDDSIAALSKENRVYKTKNGKIRIKYFLREDGDYLIEDKLVGDVWDDIPDAMHLSASEKTGYPTQKPEALLNRIITASTNTGDIVLDAFAGAGTTVASAEKLGRRWIGIDSGKLSIHTIEKRLLNIGKTATKDSRTRRQLKPFHLYEAGEHCSCQGDHEPKVKSKYEVDEQTNECVIKIERFISSPHNGGAHEYKNLETLSSVMLDYGFDGRLFRLSDIYVAEDLKEKRYEIRLPLEKLKEGGLMVVYSDIFGHEKWFLANME